MKVYPGKEHTMTERPEWLGYADAITVDTDEGMWQITIATSAGEYTFNIHGITEQLLEQVKPIEDYWADAALARDEHAAARKSIPVGDGYELGDPKHPSYHDRMSAIHDERPDR